MLNIGLARNKLSWKNTLAYFVTAASVKKKKVDVEMKPGCQIFRGGKYPIGNISPF
jgi:hypothetical protein